MGHEFFQDEGLGKDALYKISKAYSVYDEEVGYCQGFSFMAAMLLLQVRGRWGACPSGEYVSRCVCGGGGGGACPSGEYVSRCVCGGGWGLGEW